MKDNPSVIISSGRNWPLKIKSRILINTGRRNVWRVLTDYDRLTEFVPNLVESLHTLDEDGNHRVRQQLDVNVPIFKRTIKQEITVKEEIHSELLTFKATKGDMKIFEGNWLLEGNDKESTLTYNCSIKPAFYAPLWIFKIVYKDEVIASLKAIHNRSLG